MKIFWIFGFERWGGLRPSRMQLKGIVYKPVVLGLWIKTNEKQFADTV